MCFSIPYKVIKTDKDNVLIENGNLVKIEANLRVKRGDYLRVVGDVAVGKLSQKEGLKIRRLIKKLNS